MSNPVQAVAVAVSLLLLLLVIDLVRRRQLTEEYSFIWIVCAGALLVLSLWREILDRVAGWLGVFYPPAVLLLVLILFVFVASLYFSVVISRQRTQIERLVEDLAILAAQQREAAERERERAAAERRSAERLARALQSDPSAPLSYRSRFGGLWTDLVDADRVVQARLDRGLISERQATLLRHWIEKGYVVLENAIPPDVIARLNADLDAAWTGRFPSIHVEHWVDGVMHVSLATAALKDGPAKLLDLHSESKAAREAIFADPIREFLGLVFERPPLAFQSLSFMRGSEQAMHQDTAYVVVSSPVELVATWIALEDIRDRSGELEYYEGSHRLPDYLFGGRSKSMPPGDPDHQRYLDWLHERSAAMGLPRRRFRPRKGDVFVWAADLAHGGSRDIDPAAPSRRSLVTHYCPGELEPGYFQYARHSGKIRFAEDAYYCYPLRLAPPAS